MGLPVLAIGYSGQVAFEFVNFNLFDIILNLAAHGLARIIKIAGDLSLAVNHDGLAGQLLKIDAKHCVTIGDQRALMGETLFGHTSADPGLVHQPHQPAFQNARTNTAEHIIFGLALEHHRLNAAKMQQLRQKQPRGAAADNDNLCRTLTHNLSRNRQICAEDTPVKQWSKPGARSSIETSMRALGNRPLRNGKKTLEKAGNIFSPLPGATLG